MNDDYHHREVAYRRREVTRLESAIVGTLDRIAAARRELDEQRETYMHQLNALRDHRRHLDTPNPEAAA